MTHDVEADDRLEATREAVCRVVLLEGASALTTQRVASATYTSLSTLKRVLRDSVPLPVLGMQLVSRRRAERARAAVGTGDAGWPSARRALVGQAPVTEEAAVEAIVWTRLVGRYGGVEHQVVLLEEERRRQQRTLVAGLLRGGDPSSTVPPRLGELAETAEVTLEGLVARVVAAPESWPLARRVLECELNRWATLARLPVAG